MDKEQNNNYDLSEIPENLRINVMIKKILLSLIFKERKIRGTFVQRRNKIRFRRS